MGNESVLIIGAGPAGLSAGLQLKRYGIDFFLIERDEPGGLLRNANLVDNYLGFPGGIPGPELVHYFRQQVSALGVTVTPGEVTELSYTGRNFRAEMAGRAFSAPIAIIATGTKPKALPDLPVPPSLKDCVFHEVFPIRDSAGKRIAIVGAGDLAFDYALNLSAGNEVVILNRGLEHQCLPVLWERAGQFHQIDYHTQTVLKSLEPCSGSRMQITCDGPEGIFSLEIDYLLVAIGREPQMGFLHPDLLQSAPELEERGLLYWIGDVKNGIYRQAAIAAGDGIQTAMKIHRQLKGLPR